MTFFDVPDIIVYIQSADTTPAYLKLSVSLELDSPEEKAGIQALMPRVVDQFQGYLRELRMDDLRGSAGVLRLKEELMRRINAAAAPYRVPRCPPQTDDRAITWLSNPRPTRPPRKPRRFPSPGAAATAERILKPGRDRLAARLRRQQRPDAGQVGVRAIINSALVSYERLPMLEIVFDRLVRLMTTSLRNFTSDNVEVSLDSITSIRFGDYLNSIPLPAILAVFRAEQLDNYGLFTVDSNLIYSIVDVLLGGRRGSSAMAHRRSALHHHRALAGPAHDRGDPRRHVRRFRAAGASELHARPP